MTFEDLFNEVEREAKEKKRVATPAPPPAAPAAPATPAPADGFERLFSEVAGAKPAPPPGVTPPAPGSPTPIIPKAWQEKALQWGKEAVMNIPESAVRAGKTLLQTGEEIMRPREGVPSPLQAPLNIGESLARPIAGAIESGLGTEKITPEREIYEKGIKEPVQKFLEKPEEIPGKVAEYVKTHPVEVAIDFFPFGAAARAAKTVSATSAANQIKFAVRKGWTTGMHAKMDAPKHIKDIESYMDRASRVTTDMAGAKDTVKFRSAKTGEEISGRIPENLEEFGQLFDARKNEIGKIIGDANKMAAGKVQVDMAPIVNQLRDYAKTTTAQRSGAAKHANDLADFYANKKYLDISEIQEEITSFNRLVKNTEASADLASKEPINLMVLKEFRKMHDEGIQQVMGEGIKPYKQLYADYKTVEKDVVNKVRAEMKRSGMNASLIDDLISKYTLGELTFGLVTGHGLAAAKSLSFAAASRAINKLTSPDRKIKLMMSTVDDVLKKKTGATAVQRAAGPAVVAAERRIEEKLPQTDEEIEAYLKHWVKNR